MSNLIDGALIVELSDSWIDLPEPAAGTAGIEALVASLPQVSDDARARLTRSLSALLQITGEFAPGSRRSCALIALPETGRVDALLSMRIVKTVDGAYDNYLAAARALEGDAHTDLIQHVVEEVLLPPGRGILIRDFTLPVEDGGVPSPATERCFLGLFLDGHALAVEFTLLTQNLALFDDIGGYLMALASGENPPLSREDAE